MGSRHTTVRSTGLGKECGASLWSKLWTFRKALLDDHYLTGRWAASSQCKTVPKSRSPCSAHRKRQLATFWLACVSKIVDKGPRIPRPLRSARRRGGQSTGHPCPSV